MEREAAEKIVDEIIADITDRRGLKRVWYGIDDDIQSEIRDVWIDIVQVERTVG